MRNKNQKGFTLVDQLIGLMIAAIVVPTLFTCLHVVARESSEGAGQMTVGRDIVFATEWIGRDANTAQNFLDGTYPDYGTFYLLDTGMQLEREVRYYYEENQEGLVQGSLMREESLGGSVVSDVMIADGIFEYGDISFAYDSEIFLVTVQLEFTNDAGSRMISEDTAIYGHLAAEPWNWWCPYALAGGFEGLEMQASKNKIYGDVICDGPVSITGQPQKYPEIEGFLHSNYPYYHPQASDNVSITFTGNGTKIWGLASAYGEINGETHAWFNTPPSPNPYSGWGLRQSIGFDLVDMPQATVNSTEEINISWLLANGYAAQNGADIVIERGVYLTSDNVNLDVTNLNVSGRVTFVAYDIKIKGNTGAHFDFKSNDPAGILFWAENDIQIEGSSSLFWGVSYAPQGQIEFYGKAIGAEDGVRAGPVVAKKLVLRGDGVSIEH